MNAYRRLLNQYRAAVKAYNENPRRYDCFPKWTEMILEPLGEKLAAKYSDQAPYVSRILGPAGLGARTSISLYRQDARERYEKYERNSSRAEARRLADALANDSHHITFECIGEDNQRRLCVVDYSINTQSYKPGMIGFMNGFNHPTTVIPLDANLEWFTNWIHNQEREQDNG